MRILVIMTRVAGVTCRNFHVFEWWSRSIEWRVVRTDARHFNKTRIVLVVTRSSRQHDQYRLERVHHLFHKSLHVYRTRHKS